MPRPRDHPQRAAFAAHSRLIPRLLSRFEDPLIARQGHPGWTTRSVGRVRTNRLLAQGRWPASSLRASRGLTTPTGIQSISLYSDVDAASIRLPSPVRSGGISIVITAPVGDFKIRWLKMMSGPDNRTAVGRPDGINRRDSPGLAEKYWWWTQSRANPSPTKFPVKQGKNREFSKMRAFIWVPSVSNTAEL